MKTNGAIHLILLLVLGAGLALLVVYGSAIASLPVGFDTDELAHARAAWDLTRGFQTGGISGVWEVARKESFWPPLFPLFVSLSFHLFGASFAASRIPALLLSSIAIGITAHAAFTAARRASADQAASIGGATITLLAGLSTPLLLWNSSLCMIEALGLLLTALTLHTLSRDYQERRPLLASCLIGALLGAQMLTKYTFPALILPGLILAFLTAAPSWGDFLSRLRTLLGMLFVFSLSAVCWWIVADRDGISQYLFGYGSRGYSLGLPRILFYFSAFFESFVISPAVGASAIFLALVALVSSWQSLVVRFAIVSPPVSALLFGLLSEQLSRHLLIIVPCIWFSMGLGWARILQTVPSPKRRGALHLLLAFGFALTLTSRANWLTTRWFSFIEHQPGWLPLLEEAAPHIARGQHYAWFGQEAFFKAQNLRWLLAIRDQVAVRTITAQESILPRAERAALDQMLQRRSCSTEHLAALQEHRHWELLLVTDPASRAASPFVQWIRTICPRTSCQALHSQSATLFILPWDSVLTACKQGEGL